MAFTFKESASYLFTSESVTEGHPDKLCDQISDALLDAVLASDKHARVAIETATPNATAPNSAWPICITRFRSMRSARAPPNSASASMRTDSPALTMPSLDGEDVRS